MIRARCAAPMHLGASILPTPDIAAERAGVAIERLRGGYPRTVLGFRLPGNFSLERSNAVLARLGCVGGRREPLLERGGQPAVGQERTHRAGGRGRA